MANRKTEPGPPPKYRPVNIDQALGYLVEECGEVLAAVGKTQRWGVRSSNPELPEAERETNGEWVLRELRDLEAAITIARRFVCRRYESCHIEGRDYLECPCCGETAAEPDAEGLYHDGQPVTCGCTGLGVSCDSETPPGIGGECLVDYDWALVDNDAGEGGTDAS